MGTQNLPRLNRDKTQSLIDKAISLLYSSLFLMIPLVMASVTSEIFEFNKIIFIYFITILIAFFWILKMIVFKKIILKKTFFDIPILAFFLSQVASTIFSIDRHTSFFGYYGRFNGGLLSLIVYIILFYGFVSNFGKEKIYSFLKISLFSSILVIFWGLPGKLGYDLSCLVFVGQLNNSCWTEQFRPAERMFSTLGQPNWLGAYLVINFFIGLYFLFKQSDNKKYYILNTGYLLLNFSFLLFTRSRSALLAILTGIILFIGYYLFFRKIKIKETLITLFIIVVIPIIIFKTGVDRIDNILVFPISKFQTSNKSQVSSKQLSINKSNVTESFDIRKIVWRGAIELGQRYPFFGSGVETFAYAYYFVRPKEHNLTSEWDYLYNRAHNEYLNYFATTGFIGLGTYLILIFLMIIWSLSQLGIKRGKLKIAIQNSKLKSNKTIQQSKNEQLLIICLLLAYISILITNFFGFSTTTINLFFYLIPGFLILLSSDRQLETEKESTIDLFLSQKIAIVFLLPLIIYCLFLVFHYWKADTLYAKADFYLKTDNYQEAANVLFQALQLKYEHIYEDKLSYILANLAVIASSQKQEETAKKLINLSFYYNHKSLSSSPKNILYWKTKAKNHYIFYRINLDKKEIERVIAALLEGKKLSPSDPKISYSLAIFYSVLADEEKSKDKKTEFKKLALSEIEHSLYLKPDYPESLNLKKELLKKFKD